MGIIHFLFEQVLYLSVLTEVLTQSDMNIALFMMQPVFSIEELMGITLWRSMTLNLQS